MTLILTVFARHALVQVSDRRLTRGPEIVDDESGKGLILSFSSIRLVAAYTGTARFERFVTYDWLSQALLDSAGEACDPGGTFKRFTDRANSDYPAAARRDHGLTFLFTGYAHRADGARPGRLVITNQPDERSPGRFQILDQRPPDRVFWAGKTRAVRQEDTNALLDLASRDVPVDAIINKAVALFREIAERPASDNAIGKQLNSVTLPGDPAAPPICTYHSERAETKLVFPANVRLAPSDKFATPEMHMMLIKTDGAGNPIPAATLSVPPSHPNAPCPCKNGKLYRDCHGFRAK